MMTNEDNTTDTMATETDNSAAYEAVEVATMTIETKKAPKAPKAPKIKTPYPFESKARIAEKIAESDLYMLAALVQLWNRQTEHEQDTKSTVVRNRQGFMSSHSVNGSKLAEKVVSGETLTDEELAKARSIVCRYTKQLASAHRDAAVEANPDLAKVASIFGV